MSKPKMYLMCGNPGSGKTTLAKQLAKEKNARYLGIDNFYYAFYGDENAPHTHASEVWLEFFKAILFAQREGVDVVVDTNAPNKFDRYDFVSWFNFDIHLYCFNVDEDLCIKNNKSRTRVIPDDKLKAIFGKFTPPNFDEEGVWYEHITIVNNVNNEFNFFKVK